jgi:cytochrome c-type biogenesis protein CcsB
MQSSQLFGIATVAYIVAMMLYITHLVSRNKGVGVTATMVTVTGFLFQSGAFFMRWMEFKAKLGLPGIQGWLRGIPLTNLYESLIFFVWALILIYLFVEFRYKTRSFGAFVTPVAGLALAFIEMSGTAKGLQPLVPALQSNWLLVHVFMSFISYATFALAFSTGLMYLMATTEEKDEPAYIFWTVMLGIFVVVLGAMGLDFLKFGAQGQAASQYMQSYLFKATFKSGSSAVVIASLIGSAALIFGVWSQGGYFRRLLRSLEISPEMLDEITYRAIAVGFPIFTLGGLIFGAIWADQAWGVYWSWDPKETWSLITWFVYAFFLHARLMRGWRGHKAAIVSVLGFVAVIFTYLGVNLLLSGLHAYGSG